MGQRALGREVLGRRGPGPEGSWAGKALGPGSPGPERPGLACPWAVGAHGWVAWDRRPGRSPKPCPPQAYTDGSRMTPNARRLAPGGPGPPIPPGWAPGAPSQRSRDPHGGDTSLGVQGAKLPHKTLGLQISTPPPCDNHTTLLSGAIKEKRSL